MLLTEREVRIGGYCTVEFFFRFFGPSVGDVHKQAKKERDLQYPPVRTEQAQSISYLLYGKSKKQFAVTLRIPSMFVSFKLVSSFPKRLTSSGY